MAAVHAVRGRRGFRPSALLLLLAVALLPGASLALPVVQEAGWALTHTDFLENVNAAHFNPVDGKLYATSTTSIANGGGLYRINGDGTSTLLDAAERPVGVVVDHATGDVFYSILGDGVITRVDFATQTPTLWVDGFHTGDDDPVGMAIAPSNYVGAHLLPGQAVVVDEGTNGPDEVWGWNIGSPQGEFAIHSDTAGNPSPMQQPVDVTVTATDIWVVNVSGHALYKIDALGNAIPFFTSQVLGQVSAITVDPITGDLFVIEKNTDEVLRIDPVTGATSVVINGFSFIDCCTDIAGLDFSPDGSMLFVTDRGTETIYTFSMVPEPGSLLLGLVAGLALRRARRS